MLLDLFQAKGGEVLQAAAEGVGKEGARARKTIQAEDPTFCTDTPSTSGRQAPEHDLV